MKKNDISSLPSLQRIPPSMRKSRKTAEIASEQKKEKEQTSKRKRGRFRSFFFITLGIVILFIGALVGVGVGMFNEYLEQMPKISYLDDYRPSMPSRMFSGDASHLMVADFFGEKQNRKQVPLSDIPDNLIDALLAIEDHLFYEHPGVSIVGFIRAAYYDIKNRNLRNGGSTLTMQLAEDLIKNGYLDYDMPEMDLKSVRQKIMEVLLALQIEKNYTKNEILEFYLNQVFMGGNLYGVAAAADYYFNKDISELTLKECALFAGMQQRPNGTSPTRNLPAAEKRTLTVLDAMLRKGYITEEQFERAKNEPFQLNTKGSRRTQVALYPYFSDAVRRMFTEQAIKSDGGVPFEIYRQGIDIESTMNVEMQKIAEEALRRGIVKVEHTRRTTGGRHWGEPGYRGVNRHTSGRLVDGEEYDARIVSEYDPQQGTVQVALPNVQGGQGPFTVQIDPDKTWLDNFDLLHKGYYIWVKAHQEGNGFQFKPAKDEYVQGALIAVRPSTGEILAQVGGYDFNDRKNAGQFIRTVQATTLQPGSSFKPLLYTAALADREKKWTVASMLVDEEKEYWAGWTPRNFYNQYYGKVSMIYSLTHSLNAASVWLLDNYKSTRSAGIEQLRNFCRHVFDLPVEEANLSIALGTTGTTPLELAQAYSVLANEGIFIDLHMVNKVYQRRSSSRLDSNLLYEFKQPIESQVRLSPQVAYLTTYMLRNVVLDGTGKPALELPFYSVGKTGTTDDCTYAWYTGYTKDMLCIVYMGYDDFKRSLGSKMTGSKAALPVWMEFMQRAYEVQPDLFGDIDPPPGVVFHDICAESGAIASPDCPTKQRLPFEKGVEPPEDCPIHSRDSLRPYRNAANRFILMDR